MLCKKSRIVSTFIPTSTSASHRSFINVSGVGMVHVPELGVFMHVSVNRILAFMILDKR